MNNIMTGIGSFVRRHRWLKLAALRVIPDWHINRNIPGIGVMRIRIRRHRSFWLRHPLVHEWYPVGILKTFVRPGNVVWDVGANIGLLTRAIFSVAQPGRIVAFEPMAENLDDLRHNLEISGFSDRCEVVPWALGNRDGEVRFQVDDMQSATGALEMVCGDRAATGRSEAGLSALSEKVICRSLDAILDRGEMPLPDVLKIDVEGAEHLLLEGGIKFFERASPRLMIETHGVQPIKECLEFLFSRGYHVCGCVPDSWHPSRHQRLYPEVTARIADQYDVHFIAASKNATDLPAELGQNLETLLSLKTGSR